MLRLKTLLRYIQALLVLVVLGSYRCLGLTGKKAKALKDLTKNSQHIDKGCIAKAIRLSLANNPSQIQLSWLTDKSDCKLDFHIEKKAKSFSGISSLLPDSLFQVFRQRYRLQYDSIPAMVYVEGALQDTQACGDRAGKMFNSNSYKPKKLNNMLIGDLDYGLYQYTINNFASTYFHKRRISKKDSEDSLTILMFGDMGYSNSQSCPGALQTAKLLQNMVHSTPIDFVMNLGDISYADGDPVSWIDFLMETQNVSSRVPYMIAVGNHDYAYKGANSKYEAIDGAGYPQQRALWGKVSDSRGECGVPVKDFFNCQGLYNDSLSVLKRQNQALQKVLQGGYKLGSRCSELVDNPPFWYAFHYKQVFMIVLSSEHRLDKDSLQMAWLKCKLRDVDRRKYPWIFVISHRPMYTPNVSNKNMQVALILQDQLEETLIKYQVNMIASGHVHMYFRSCKVHRASCTDSKAGILQVVNGAGGHKFGSIKGSKEPYEDITLQEYGISKVDVIDKCKVVINFISSKTSKTMDRFVLRNDALPEC